LLLEKLKSLQTEPSWEKEADGRNSNSHQKAWQVLKSAFLFPVLGKVLPRDLSPLKPLLVEALWNRVRRRLVPLEVGGRPNEGFFEQPPMREFFNLSLSSF